MQTQKTTTKKSCLKKLKAKNSKSALQKKHKKKEKKVLRKKRAKRLNLDNHYQCLKLFFQKENKNMTVILAKLCVTNMIKKAIMPTTALNQKTSFNFSNLHVGN